MDGLIDPFYEPAPDKGPDDIERGEIYLDQPQYLPAKHGILLTNFDPTDQRDPDIEITGRTENIFQHPPLRRYQLQHGEAFIVGKAKWNRPVVILAARGWDLLAGPDLARRADTYLCAPIYGADQFSEDLRRRARAYEFPNLFFLPQSRMPPFDEGFVRFDAIQAISRHHLRRRHPTRLSVDAVEAMDDWLIRFLTGRLRDNSLIEEYRNDLVGKGEAPPLP